MKAFLATLEPQIVDMKMNEWFDAHGVQLDLRPLRERYGIERKPGSAPPNIVIQNEPKAP